MNGSPFSPRVLVGLVTVLVVAFVVSVLLVVRGDHPETVGPSTFSVSAIGHRGLMDLLRQAGVPIRQALAGEASAPLGPGEFLVVAEPSKPSTEDLARIAAAPNLLVVLPKRSGRPDPVHEGWLASVDPIDAGRAEDVARLIAPDAELVRRPARSDPWPINRLGVGPEVSGEVQLVVSPHLQVLIGGPEGILLGRLDAPHRNRWILADPDPLENHGLGQGRNADFALALLAAPTRRLSLVFDEAVHGIHSPVTSPVALLFRFPYGLVTLHGAVVLVLLGWAGAARFGPALVAPPALKTGSGDLIDTVARLLDEAGHRPETLRRYIALALCDAARRLRAPPSLPEAEALPWLKRNRAARAPAGLLDEVAASIASGREADLIRTARALHSWNQGLEHGSHGT